MRNQYGYEGAVTAYAPIGEDSVRVSLMRCIICKESHHVKTLPMRGFKDWQSGKHIQHAFPELTPGERETLQSGMHEKCFDRAFADVEAL